VKRGRDDVEKGFDQNDITKTIGKARAAGINVIGNFIFGLPEDDPPSMQATLDLALTLNCEFANFDVAMAYPGSQLFSVKVGLCQKLGMATRSMRWKRFLYLQSTFLLPKFCGFAMMPLELYFELSGHDIQKVRA
jgi:hypothetical protein